MRECLRMQGGADDKYVQTANPASSRLAEKLGFVVAEKLMIQWPEDKGGDWREVAIWQREM